MHSWPNPEIPKLDIADTANTADTSDTSGVQAPELFLYDTADDAVKPVKRPDPGHEVGVYVCGITPYDSTHLGHAATYLTFDLINRYLIATGSPVHYVQNITDVDDPLFERAERDGVDWRELGTSQINLFRSDMEALEVIPPRDYIGAMESIDEVVAMVERLLEVGAAYQLDDEYPDIYADHTFTSQFGYESRYDESTMDELFAERGGDPDRPGKRHPLDALLWRAHREGEPAWEAPFGAGRPGWHIECSAIATNRLGASFAIQGGGSDLRFPHHEYSAAHAEAAHNTPRMAEHYVHAGMIGLDGVKMSKSLGNLVFVSKLTAQGHDPSAIRLGVFASHYRGDRDWSDEVLATAEQRLSTWREALRRAEESALNGSTAPTAEEVRDVIQDITARIAQDLDTPGALAAMDQFAQRLLARADEEAQDGRSLAASDIKVETTAETTAATTAAQKVRSALYALLGVRV
ncbi:cysteine--1-D-myo-inosityl 2-amino-2-deoxy-alpha-D-glucopyranoside ligase [Corynebacterium falsenii]|uniref:cysteine--1-D-myo-inosityl 2-amino-2-deoxy-alpha-D-glucopyranoside ligase n=1 Tax=Corynebacterium falsenii TaxID=108486 RepID=UPI001E023CC5|nr:cysteine--1-D-myo-inosityl 2-amino-2-deoxy-alpha-D-glucopyranoside ligase [Corynebacterium falsenii]MDC7104520.1 cysteine--1-D-myo-inosityl 2-amino-2-deoxy-alpha-D-glucopyranoside ligase [Corynebacterium falsenii]HJF11910.1 cysteine--1-D-myo-inosityl 2-amino-2-deoxy-alpha-D-glucopyranoside ligase [Corynebacterium falsenii]